jgi:hypothetical protein
MIDKKNLCTYSFKELLELYKKVKTMSEQDLIRMELLDRYYEGVDEDE